MNRLQANLKKLRIIYLPFLAVTVAFIVTYTFVNWLFFIRSGFYPIREELINFWLPIGLPWIPISIWLRPKIKLLDLRGANGHIPFFYEIIAAVAMAFPTILAQDYVEKITGDLTKIETIDAIGRNKKSKYYSVEKLHLDKNTIGISSYCRYSINLREIHMLAYYVLPIISKPSDTAKLSCPAWLGVEYTAKISNQLSPEEKGKRIYDFVTSCQNDFKQINLDSIKFLKRVSDAKTNSGFRKAKLNTAKILSRKSPVFLAVEQPVEDTGNALAGLIGSYAIFAGIWLILLAIPKFAGPHPHAECYVLEWPELAVLEAVNAFKAANPHHYRPGFVDLADGYCNESPTNYQLYFYYPETYQIVYAIIRTINDAQTEIGFVALCDALMPGKWTDVNNHMIGEENALQKEIFKSVILDGIRKQLACDEKAA